MTDIIINTQTLLKLKKLSISDLNSLIDDLTKTQTIISEHDKETAKKFETMIHFCIIESNKRIEDIFNFTF